MRAQCSCRRDFERSPDTHVSLCAGYWEKKANSDIVVRVPMLLHVPWATPSAGQHTMSPTELVDVFPTLASLAGVPPPPNVSGTDLSPLLADPSVPLKDAAYHQYPACNITTTDVPRVQCDGCPRHNFTFMSYSMRTADWRYTAWFPWNGTALRPIFSDHFAAELYNHTGDDGTAATGSLTDFENVNLAEELPDVAAQLHAQLVAFFDTH